jgi:hypothetical protein
MGRSSSTKAEWLGVLETAAKLSVEQSSAVWVWIMQELRLGPQYFLAIREEVVQQGRWRTAKNPKAYIKTAAKRQALKMGLVTEDSGNLVPVGRSRSDREEISGEEMLEHLGQQYDSREAAKGEDGTWRVGAGAERDYSGITAILLRSMLSGVAGFGNATGTCDCDAALRRRGGEQGSESR